MHATEYLKKADNTSVGPVAVLHGGERHLVDEARRRIAQVVLGDDPDEMSITRYTGKTADIRDVRDELLTISMFSSARLVIVEDADEFVTKFRSDLEDYVDGPSSKSVLVLTVKTWRKNTKLAKKVAKVGLDVECSELTGTRLTTWLTAHAAESNEKRLTRDAASLMVELAGTSLGLLEQELGKLTSYVGDRPKINVDDVRTLVGGWKAETTWTMINAVRDDQIGTALECLDKLLIAGEAPQKILGGVNFVFRKFAQATERARQGIALAPALKESGVFPRDVTSSEQYLRRIGRPRAERIQSWLLEADGHLKGGSRISDRLLLEQLLLRLSGTV